MQLNCKRNLYHLIYNNFNILKEMVYMDKNEIFNLINQNPVFFLAITDGDQPRVRGMLLYRADESVLYFIQER